MKFFMNVVKKIMMGLMLMIPILCNAQSPGKPTTGTLTRLDTVKLPKKHRAPSIVSIECAFTGSGFSFLHNGIFVTLSVTVTNVNTGEIWSDILEESEGYLIETGPISVGTYSVYATNENGVEFYGELELSN